MIFMLLICRLNGYKVVPIMEQTMVRDAFTVHDTVSLSGCRISYEDLEALLYFEGANHELLHLTLCSNHLSVTSICLLAKTLGTGGGIGGGGLLWPKLTNINLSYNVMDTTCMQMLVTGIHSLKQLKVLNLSGKYVYLRYEYVLISMYLGCSIRPNTVHVLTSYLSSDTCIKELNLAFNYLDNTGGMSIAQMIEQNCTMTNLNLRKNGLGYSGGSAIAEALRRNYMLQILCVADNDIGIVNLRCYI